MATATYQPELLDVSIERMVDSDPDFSYLGEYSAKPGPDDRTIDRNKDGRGHYHNGRRYFIAAMSGTDTGNPESVMQDYKRMEAYNDGEWHYLGIRAVAIVRLTEDGPKQKITSGGLWGIESDSDESCFAEVEAEQRAELADQLLAMGIDPEAVSEQCETEND